AVGPNLLDLAGLSVGGFLEELPVRHLGRSGNLAVDCPARAVIVRRTVLRALIDMGENAKMKIGILVEHPPFVAGVRAEISGDELRIGARPLGVLAHPLPTRRTTIVQKRRPA